MSYEQSIRDKAEQVGCTVTKERGGLRITDADGGSCWHRLGGHAEELFDYRQKHGLSGGRWIKAEDRLASVYVPYGTYVVPKEVHAVRG